jgi:hypothetical protein
VKTIISHVLSFFFIALAVSIIPAERLIHELVDTERLVHVAQRSRTYERVAALLADTLSRMEPARRLCRTPLAISSEEIRSVLVRCFPEDWFFHQMRVFHRGLLARSDTGKPAAVRWILSDRKELVTEHLIGLTAEKMASLPPCSERDAARIASLSHSPSRSVRVEDLVPPCRPPAPLERRLLDGLRKPIAEWISALPDTVDSRTFTSSSLSVEGSLNLGDAERYRSRFALAGYLLLLLLLAGISAANLDNRPQWVQRLSFVLLISGACLSLVSGPATAYFSRQSPSVDSGALAGIVHAAALELLIQFLRALVLDYSIEILRIGAALVGVGLLLWSIARFGIKRPGTVE